MPCRYDDNGASARQQREELDRVTRLLCEACGHLTAHPADERPMSKELQEWWEDHQRRDAARLEAERHQRTTAELTERATYERLKAKFEGTA